MRILALVDETEPGSYHWSPDCLGRAVRDSMSAISVWQTGRKGSGKRAGRSYSCTLWVCEPTGISRPLSKTLLGHKESKRNKLVRCLQRALSRSSSATTSQLVHPGKRCLRCWEQDQQKTSSTVNLRLDLMALSSSGTKQLKPNFLWVQDHIKDEHSHVLTC